MFRWNPSSNIGAWRKSGGAKSTMMKSAIGAETEEQCPQSLLPTEKRKHAGVGDGSPHSKPIPPEKRSCVENGELPPDFLPEQNLYECKEKKRGEYVGPTFDELPPYDQKRLMRFREKFGPDWPKSAMGSHNGSDEQIGNLGNFYEDEDQKENRQGSALKEENTYVCPNPFEPLNFKENDGLYSELRVFAEKAVPYCNAIFKKSLCFEDIEKVTSCQSDCNHHLVTIKVADPCDKMSVVVLRGRVRSGGFAEAKVQDFVILGAYKP